MIRDCFLATSLALAIGFSCNGGRLDAFAEQPAGVSGNGGSTATGGRGGTGIEPTGGEGGVDSDPDMLLVDNFEDGNQVALIQHAEWYISHNNTGVQNIAVEMPAVELLGSVYSMHTSGVGFEDSGPSLVLGIAGNDASIDVSAYAALTFQARAEAGSARNILFAFLVGSQHFAVPLTLGTEWGIHTIPFTAAIPVQSGPDTRFDPTRLAAIQFVAPERESFDFWLDDLAFVK